MKLARKAVAALVFATATMPALAATITFDALTPGYTEIADGYAGLDWTNFYAIAGDSIPETGYMTGVVSPGNIAFNGYATPASFGSAAAFTLNSLYLTKAWSAGMTRFDGYVGSVLAYSLDVYATTTGPTLVNFANWTDLTNVVMSTQDGSQQAVIDNITINAVPEPETYAMLLGGLAVVGAIARRKRQA